MAEYGQRMHKGIKHMNIKYDIDEVHEYVRKLRAIPTDDLNIMFIMTAECNFRCTYCYEHKRPNERLNLDSAKHVLDKLFPIEDNDDYWNGFFDLNKKKNKITFDFFGGECLLEIDNIDAICDYFIKLCDSDPDKYRIRKDNFRFTIQTNGVLVRTPRVMKFIEKWKNNITLFISIDGTKECHDACRVFKDTNKPTWDIVSQTIYWVRENYPNIPVETKGTITPDNVKYLYDSYLEYQKLGFKSIKTTIGLFVPWDDESLKILKKQYELISEDLLKNHLRDDISFFTFDYRYMESRIATQTPEYMGCGTCGTNGCQIVITPRDEICTCHIFTYLAQPDNRESYAIGNVKNGITPEGLIHNSLIQKYIYTNFFKSDKCKMCSSKVSCEVCPGTAFKKLNNDFETKMDEPFEIDDCDARRIESHARLIYQYKKEVLLCQKENQ